MKGGKVLKISINTMQKLSKIKNSVYDAIKIEYLYHSNKLEGSTFSKENLIDLLEQKQVNRWTFFIWYNRNKELIRVIW